jgi:cbb3-type cytochrome oxidase maturation protein
MEVLYLLIPVSLVFVGLIAWVFLWAVRSGQFDDMEGPAHQILMDDDGPVSGKQNEEDADEDAGKQSSRPE